VLPQETPGEFGPHSRIGNAFMAAAPDHPFFKAVLDELRTNPPLDTGDNVSVLHTTGPLFLTKVLRRLPQEDRVNLVTPDSELFSPVKPSNPAQRRAIIDKGVAYGIHHCVASWREYTLPQLVRERLHSIVHRFIVRRQTRSEETSVIPGDLQR